MDDGLSDIAKMFGDGIKTIWDAFSNSDAGKRLMDAGVEESFKALLGAAVLLGTKVARSGAANRLLARALTRAVEAGSKAFAHGNVRQAKSWLRVVETLGEVIMRRSGRAL
jgi:hypothetical protein